MKLAIVFLTIQAISLSLYAQKHFKTIPYDESLGSPRATLESLKWLPGSWKGEALGGTTEEVWTPPSGGSMMCVFKLIVDDKVSFYELVTIVELNETLLLRLKHFDKNLHGWETKDETIDFRLVKITPDRVYFDEFTFERISENEINIYVMIGSQDGSPEEVKFNYHKADL